MKTGTELIKMDLEAPEHCGVENLIAAFLVLAYIIFKALSLQATSGNNLHIMRLSNTLRYLIL